MTLRADSIVFANRTLRALTDDFQRKVVRDCLERHDGNRTNAARELGMSREGLFKLIKRLGVQGEPEKRERTVLRYDDEAGEMREVPA